MKVLYATDLHGHSKKFNLLKNKIKDHELLIIGSDILPKHQSHHKFLDVQRKFIEKFLFEFFKEIEIPLIIDMGNDDLKCLQPIFNSVVDQFPNVYSSHLKSINVNGYYFNGMNYVPDYPFGLKDWCRRDGTRLSDPFQISRSVLSTMDGLKEIKDLDKYFSDHNSIEYHLNNLPVMTRVDKRKYVFISHAPPKGIGLDVCADYRSVGSLNIANHIAMTQPVASLHGHIHESPFKSGFWYNKIVNTFCIQPGQTGKFQSLIYSEFDLTNIVKTLKRKEIS